MRDDRTQGYRPGLGYGELLDELRRLLDDERAVERLICRYLADLADAVERDVNVLGAHADIYHLSRNELGLEVRQTRERIRIGKALRELPAIEEAFLAGEISYSRTREVTRVASSGDEQQWLMMASTLPIRALERRVAEANGGHRDPASDGRREADPAEMHHLTPDVVEMRIALPADVAALLRRAMEGAKRSSERSMSDPEALEAVARDALANQDGGDGDPRRTVVLYECRHCERVELETGVEPAELPPGTGASLGCGAKVVDLETAGRQVKRGGAMPAAVKNAVLLRDRSRCRVPGCHLRRYVEVHHLAEQSKGGEHSRRNCLTLCSRHHQWLHEGKLRIEGDADGELRVYDVEGRRVRNHRDVTPSARKPSAVTGGGVTGGGVTGGGVIGGGVTGSGVTGSGVTGGGVTHSGSWAEVATSQTEAELLAAMGRRGGWRPDSLCDATGLGIREINTALTRLTLAGRVVQDGGGCFAASG